MSAPRVLVTGATGFLGRPAVRALREAGFEVHACARRLPQDAPADAGEGTRPGEHWHAVDLLEFGAAERLVAQVRPSHLLHLAWEARPGLYWTSPANAEWVAATICLLRAFGRTGGRRAVCAGSCAEYDWSHDELIEDQTPLAPRTLYGQAKHAAHEMCAALAPSLGVSLAWGRVFFLYGPGEAPRRLVPDVVGALLRGQPAQCTAGTQERDFLHVEDAARAFACALRSDFEGAFNIASGHCAPVRDLVLALGQACGRPELLSLGARPMPEGEPPRLAASIGRLRGPIGFVPRYDLASGIAQTVAWWRNRPL